MAKLPETQTQGKAPGVEADSSEGQGGARNPLRRTFPALKEDTLHVLAALTVRGTSN